MSISSPIGGKHIPEIELTHLDGHKGSKPVRIGNGAADHKQLVSLFLLYIGPILNRGYIRISMVNCESC